MKKNILILLPLLLLTACAGENGNAIKNIARPLAVEDRETIYDNLLTNLTDKAIHSEATITTNYDGATYHVIDEVSSSARRSYDVLDGRIQNLRDYTKGEDENAIQNTLTISNTIRSTQVLGGDDGESPVDFDAAYGSPFLAVNQDNIERFFTIAEGEDGLEITPTAYGKAILSTSLDTFYPMHDSYVWDSRTVTSYATDIVLLADETGTPEKLSFTHIRKDAYGGIAELVEADLTIEESVQPLSPISSSLTAEEQESLNQAISGVADKIAGGNFTQTIHLGQADGIPGVSSTYHSYYDLPYTTPTGNTNPRPDKNFGLMLSDFNYFAENSSDISGESHVVYTGLGYGWRSSEDVQMEYGYWAIGVTPDTEYFGMVSNEFYASIAEAIPTIGLLSADFFSATDEENIYTFDLTTFRQYDRTFAIDLMTALLGPGDYPSHISPAFYISDEDSLSFDFTSVTIDITDPETPVFSLSYIDVDGESQTTTTSFSDFGTTDLLNIPDASAEFQEAIEVALNVLFSSAD